MSDEERKQSPPSSPPSSAPSSVPSFYPWEDDDTWRVPSSFFSVSSNARVRFPLAPVPQNAPTFTPPLSKRKKREGLRSANLQSRIGVGRAEPLTPSAEADVEASDIPQLDSGAPRPPSSSTCPSPSPQEKKRRPSSSSSSPVPSSQLHLLRPSSPQPAFTPSTPLPPSLSIYGGPFFANANPPLPTLADYWRHHPPSMEASELPLSVILQREREALERGTVRLSSTSSSTSPTSTPSTRPSLQDITSQLNREEDSPLPSKVNKREEVEVSDDDEDGDDEGVLDKEEGVDGSEFDASSDDEMEEGDMKEGDVVDVRLDECWVLGPEDFAVFEAEGFNQEGKADPSTLITRDLRPHMGPTTLIRTLTRGVAAMYVWQIHAPAAGIIQLMAAITSKLADPTFPDYARRAFNRFLMWLKAHPEGGYLHYFGESFNMSARYASNTLRQGNGDLHHFAKQYAKKNPEVLGFSFGVLAHGEASDHAKRQALSLEGQVGRVLGLTASSYSSKGAHVLNQLPLGIPLRYVPGVPTTFSPLYEDPDKLRALAYRFYTAPLTITELQLHLQSVLGREDITNFSTVSFVGNYLKPIAVEAGVKESLITHGAASGRRRGQTFDLEGLVEQAEILIDSGLRLGFNHEGRKHQLFAWGYSLAGFVDFVFEGELQVAEKKQLAALLQRVSKPFAERGDQQYAVIREHLLARSEALDRREDPIKFDRDFDIAVDAIPVYLPGRTSTGQRNQQLYKCKHCTDPVIAFTARLAAHYFDNHKE